MMKSWVPVLNFRGVTLVPLLNFQGVLRSNFLNFRWILGLTYKLREGFQVQSTKVPGPGVPVPILHCAI